MYGHPIFLPIILHIELYRLEINSRNLENEKKSRYYNELIYNESHICDNIP